MRRLIIRSVLIAAALPAIVRSETLQATPVTAQATTGDGVTWTIDDAATSLNTARFDFTDIERRGLLEFDLNALPDEASITAVTLELDINSFTSGAGPATRVLLNAYPGDGVLTENDAIVPLNLAGVSGDITALELISIDLDPEVIAGALATSETLGLVVVQATTNRQAQCWASDGFGSAPNLIIEFSGGSDSTVTLSAIDGGVERLVPQPWSLTTDGVSITTGISATTEIERRAILEFDLAPIPDGMAVIGASIRIDISLVQFPPSPQIEFHGYAGDGLLSPADADEPRNLLATSPTLTELEVVDIPVDPEYIDALRRADGSHLGLRTEQPVLNTQVSFYATEAAAFARQAPELTLTLADAPCPCNVTDFSEDTPGQVNIADLLVYLDLWFNDDPQAERTGDLPANIDILDLLEFLSCWLDATGGTVCP